MEKSRKSMNSGLRLASIVDELSESISRPRRLIGASILRICLGTIVLLHYLIYFRLREFVWGPGGQVSYPDFLRRMHERHDPFSVYALSNSHAYFVFVLGIVVTLIYVVGWQTRISGVLMFVFTWSLLHRNDQITNGGHNMLLLILFYLMFADVGRYFSIDGLRSAASPSPRPRLIDRLLGVIHNYAIATCVLQVVVMYLFSTFYKLQGHKWQDGTALYYILRCEQFSLPAVSPAIYHNAALVMIGTYSTLIFQSAFPWLIFNRRLKWLMVLGACMFHASIAILMGLVSFSATIIAVDAILIDDASYMRVRRALQFARDCFAAWFGIGLARRRLAEATWDRVLR